MSGTHSSDPPGDQRESARPGTERIGLFGGTFNPIHLGHLRAAEEVREALGLTRVHFIPSHTPPHKTASSDDPVAPTPDRLAWVEQAIAGHAAFAIDRIEINRAGRSFLVDTLLAIREREAGRRRTVFIVGEDAFAEMGDWRAPEALFALTDLAVMTRPPGGMNSLADRLPEIVRDAYVVSEDGSSAVHREAGTRIERVAISALDISSSKVRKACRAGRSIRYLVPEPIRGAIEASGHYGPIAHDPIVEP